MVMKTCFKCGETKPLDSFHKHKGMKDGHLNKCSACVVKDVAEWREKNPECRKREHARTREREGHRTNEEWRAYQQQHKLGRKTVAKKYAFKRRRLLEKQELTELDELVLVEAFNLAEKREKITGFQWHVDHIVPLFHKKACGLNNAYNLQVVPGGWNFKKGNRNMDTYWNEY
jgi:hypothetical protein